MGYAAIETIRAFWKSHHHQCFLSNTHKPQTNLLPVLLTFHQTPPVYPLTFSRTLLVMSSLQCLERELPSRGLSAPPPNPKYTHILYKHTHTQVRKWKSDLFRATLGLVEAAAAEPAGTQCAIMKEQEKPDTTGCCLVSTSAHFSL